MIIINKGDPVPDGVTLINNVNDKQHCFFDDDAECIAYKLNVRRNQKYYEVVNSAKLELDDPDKNDKLRNIRDAALAGVGHRGKTPAETKQDFKDMVVNRELAMEERDTKIAQIESAATIDELEAIQ